ncbi:MAG TPA: aldo/keto reductase [Candidatus Krumholzibacteria bacterium]|nr:aldo/keto reductase [Candidatus Krumholzibacteria bacterium]
MTYRMLGSSGVKVYPLCLGTMNFGNDGWGCDEDTSVAILNRYLDRGGNFVDTANVYSGGRSEEILGRALEGRRDDVVLATKGYFPLGPDPNRTGNSRRNLRRSVEDSLRRLRTDRIDLYQLHIWDPLTPIEETLGVLDDMVHEGLIHYLGCCNFTAWQIALAQERADQNGLERFVTVQPQYNLLCRDIEIEIMGVADYYDMGILPWSPLAFGLLSGKYDRASHTGPGGARMNDPHENDVMAKWKQRTFTDDTFDVIDLLKVDAERLGTTPVALSLRWLLEQPAVASPIVGPRTVEQLDQNLDAAELEVDTDTLDRLDAATVPYETYLDFMQAGYLSRRTEDLD